MMRRGFTVIEISIVIAILALVFGITFIAFRGLLGTKTLAQTSEGVVSFLRQTREKTLAQESGYSYNVRIEAARLIRFRAPTYVDGAPTNEISTIPSGFRVASWAFNGGGQTIVFKPITGATNNFGQLTVEQQSDPAKNKVIKIYETGVIESN